MLAAAAAPEPTVEVSGPCVDAARLTAEIGGAVPSPDLALVITSTRTGFDRIQVEVTMRATQRRDRRRFDLVEADCPFAAALIARVWRRFLSELPVLLPAGDPASPLIPGWPNRRSWRFDLGLSPGFGVAERWEARLSRTEGPAGSYRWRVGVGYDLVRVARLGEGSASIHSGFLFGGPSWSWAGRGAPADVALLAGLGFGVGVGAGFPDNVVSFVPVARLRGEVRTDLFRMFGAWSLDVGAFAEVSAIDLRLVGPDGGTYREPLARAGLFVGFGRERLEFFSDR